MICDNSDECKKDLENLTKASILLKHLITFAFIDIG